MRLFIALNLPKKERERIYRAARKLREEEMPVQWLEAEHFHVTLKFLGEVRQDGGAGYRRCDYPRGWID